MSDKKIKLTKIAVFRKKAVRRTIYKNEWWFSGVDVIETLTESDNPQVYWRVLKKRLKDEGSNETVTNCNDLKVILDMTPTPQYFGQHILVSVDRMIKIPL